MNKKNPKVTVYMSAYNHEQYVEQAILSIINQTYQDFELLVIDDGSTDRTSDILERLSQEHGFHFESQENLGLPRTLNKLISMAKGEYITGCASDDFWPPNRLEEQIQEFVNDDYIDMVHANVLFVDVNSSLVPVSISKNRKMPVDGRTEFLPLIAHRRRYNTTSMMVRRSSFNSVGYYDESIGVEDFDWWVRATRILNIKFCQERTWTFYRVHSNNWVRRPDGALKSVKSHYAVVRKLGIFHGSIFFMTKISGVMLWETIARRKRRYFYIFLFPFLFWNLSFIKSSLFVVFGEVCYVRWKDFIIKK